MTPAAKRLASRMRGSEEERDDYESEDGNGPGEDKKALAREVWDAVKNDDFESFGPALHEYVLACLEGDDEPKAKGKAKLLIGVG